MNKEQLLKELGFKHVTHNLYSHETEYGMFTFDNKKDIVAALIRFGEDIKAAEIRSVLGIKK